MSMNRPDTMILMFQKEFALKLLEKKLNTLNSLINCFYRVKHEFHVSRNCFRPVPKVDSTILYFSKIEEQLIQDEKILDYIKFRRKIFSQKRKKIKSSFASKNLFQGSDFENKRAEELSLDEFVKIFNTIF